MQLWQGGAIFAAGAGAGAINAAVGSGTLMTFSTLVGLGYPPLVANISNNLGLITGNLAGAWGYRRELRGWMPVVRRLMPWSVAGAALGAVLLLVLPSGAFDAIVPVLIGLAVVLVVIQPRLAARMLKPALPPAGDAEAVNPETASTAPRTAPRTAPVRPLLLMLLVGCGVYGGYFGAAQGVLLLALLGGLFTDSLQLANGLKNILTVGVNSAAAIIFAIVAWHDVDWAVVVLIAAGGAIGGLAGAAAGRRMPAVVLRGFIVLVGCLAIARLLWWS